MKSVTLTLTLISVLLFPVLVWGGERERSVLNEKMIPLAREFIKRSGLPYDSEFKTNSVRRHQVDFFDDGRPGGIGSLSLENGCSFMFFWNDKAGEVRSYHDKTKTYYHLDFAPKEQIDSVVALNSLNKLNDQTALELAKKLFKLQGHKEDDFRPPALNQLGWTGGPPEYKPLNRRLLPYYRAEWYRKDVKTEDMTPKLGKLATLPHVTIEISGINSTLVRYEKISLPLGSDF